MAEIDCLGEFTGWIDLEFIERERTPGQIIEVGALFRRGVEQEISGKHIQVDYASSDSG